MADLQMSRSGPSFQKISLLHAKVLDFALWADSGDEAATLETQETEIKICVVPKAGLALAKTYILKKTAKKNSVITFACSEMARSDVELPLYVHGN